MEVHAYSLLPTHFHLLLTSPTGCLSESLRKIQNSFVRHFNRRAHRDGPLFRGRFLSKRVDTEDYRIAVVRYIDANPVGARIVARTEAYPHGSAASWAHGDPPRWLSTRWVGARVSQAPSGLDPLSRYLCAFPRAEDPTELEWVERRLRRPFSDRDGPDDLVGGSPEKLRAWMDRKARLADGTGASLPSTSPSRISHLLSQPGSVRLFRCLSDRAEKDLRCCFEVALLREFTDLTWPEVAQRLGLSPTAARRWLRSHGQLLKQQAYRAAFESLVEALFGSPPLKR